MTAEERRRREALAAQAGLDEEAAAERPLRGQTVAELVLEIDALIPCTAPHVRGEACDHDAWVRAPWWNRLVEAAQKERGQ